MALLVLSPHKLRDWRREKQPTASCISVCVCAPNHQYKLGHFARALITAWPSSHGTVEVMSSEEPRWSTLPLKPTTPRLLVFFFFVHRPMTHSPSLFSVLFCAFRNSIYLKTDILSVCQRCDFEFWTSLGWHPLCLNLPLPLLPLFQGLRQISSKNAHRSEKKTLSSPSQPWSSASSSSSSQWGHAISVWAKKDEPDELSPSVASYATREIFEVKKLSSMCRENSRYWFLAHKLVRKLNGAKCRRNFERLMSYQIANNGAWSGTACDENVTVVFRNKIDHFLLLTRIRLRRYWASLWAKQQTHVVTQIHRHPHSHPPTHTHTHTHTHTCTGAHTHPTHTHTHTATK